MKNKMKNTLLAALAIIAIMPALIPARAAAGGINRTVTLPEPAGSVFYVAVISDAHVSTAPDNRYNAALAAVGDRLSAMSPAPDMVIHTGDAVDDLELPWGRSPRDYVGPDRKEIPVLVFYKDIVSAHFKMPYFDIPGNHDFYWNKIWKPGTKAKHIDRMLVECLEEISSMPAPYYTIERGGFHLVALDSVDGAESHADSWVGRFGDAQMDWLEQVLSDGKPAVIFMHHYPGTPEFRKYVSLDDGHLMPESGRIFKIMSEHSDQVKMIFVGHGEIFCRDELYGIPEYMSGQPEDTPGFYLVEFNSAAGAVRLHNAADIDFMNDSINN